MESKEKKELNSTLMDYQAKLKKKKLQRGVYSYTFPPFGVFKLILQNYLNRFVLS